MRNEIKLLHKKQQILNEQLYHSHFELANVWVLFLARQPPVGRGLLIHEVSRSNTTTHYNR